MFGMTCVAVLPISIHALHEESDTVEFTYADTGEFQSTLSMRRATDSLQSCGGAAGISIHALHEESDSWCACRTGRRRISIHALHEESDSGVNYIEDHLVHISIHALHEESDYTAK